MKWRFFVVLPMLAGIVWLVGGCSSTGPSVVSYDPNKPQTFLAGAEVQQAKSLAMGSAVSKGWRVLESSDNRLIVDRPLDANAAQSVTGEPVSTASIEVKSEFFKRQDGVNVAVDASLIANKGSETERRVDFTDSYKNDLNRSLSSLRQAWDDNRWRVASSTPPLPTKVAVPEDEVSPSGASDTSDALVADSGSPPTPGDGAGSAPVAPPWPASVPVATSTAGAAAPVEDRTAGALPSPTAASPAPASPGNNMMALDRQTEPGIWAYYAEHYAKIRGCEVSGNGAVLEQKLPEYELHRVYCENGTTFLVQCNAGTCRGTE